MVNPAAFLLESEAQAVALLGPEGYRLLQIGLTLPHFWAMADANKGNHSAQHWATLHAMATGVHTGLRSRAVIDKIKQGQAKLHTATIREALLAVGNPAALDAARRVVSLDNPQLVAAAVIGKDLDEANRLWAAEYFKDFPLSATTDKGQTINIPTALGIRTDIPKAEQRAVMAAQFSQMATAHGLSVYALFNDEAQVDDLKARLETPEGSGGNFFKKILDGARRLVRDPAGWARRVFVTDPGKLAEAIGTEILRGRKNIPFLGRYVLDPLGFTAQATFLQQLGAAMRDGSINTFDETKLAVSTAQTFNAAGEALLVAAPFLPVPFNVAAAGLGALSKASGVMMLKMIQDAKTSRQIDEIKDLEDDARAERERAEKEAKEAAERAEAARAELQRVPQSSAAPFGGLLFKIAAGLTVAVIALSAMR